MAAARHPNNYGPVAMDFIVSIYPYHGVQIKPKTNELSMRYFGIPLSANSIGTISDGEMFQGLKMIRINRPNLGPVLIPAEHLFQDFNIEKKIGGKRRNSRKMRRTRFTKRRK